MTVRQNQLQWLDILQTNQLNTYVQTLEQHTGRTGVLADVTANQTQHWQQALQKLDIAAAEPTLAELRAACARNLAVLNQIVVDTVGTFDWERVIVQLKQLLPSEVVHGQFLKRACLMRLVAACPPQRTLAVAGYRTINDYLKHESVYELLAAARFTESSDWMQHYLQLYRSLTPRDFSYQPVQFLLLDPQRWWTQAAPFAAKKKHNFSHLKEAGVVFWYPDPALRTDHTQLHRLLLMLLHYIYEVHFYSNWFEQYLFALNRIGDYFVDTLLGDTTVCAIDQKHIPILQQYHLKLAHPNPCVYDPHTMSEALHWSKAIHTLNQLIAQHPQYQQVAFWEKCYTVVQPVEQRLVSLNLMDQLLSTDDWLLYHAREDVWNAIFTWFTGDAQFEQTILHNFTTKQIDLTALT
jgi:hypothetical protein